MNPPSAKCVSPPERSCRPPKTSRKELIRSQMPSNCYTKAVCSRIFSRSEAYRMSIAIVSTPKGPVALGGSPQGVISIVLPPANPGLGISANWVILAKTTVTNPNPLAVPVLAQLVVPGPFILDTSAVDIPGGGGIAQCLSLQGKLTTSGSPVCVELFGSSNAPAPLPIAQSAQLMAISVDLLESSPGC